MDLKLDLRQRLSENITKVIEDSNISKKMLGERLGVSQATISNWINGKNSPDVGKLFLFCEMFDLSIDDLYSEAPINSAKKSYGQLKLQLLTNFDRLSTTGKLKIIDLTEDLIASGRYETIVRHDNSGIPYCEGIYNIDDDDD